MPRAYTDAVREATDAWNRGDIDAFMTAYHEDAVLVLIGGFEGMIGRAFHGRAEIRRFFEEFTDAFEQRHVEVEEVRPVGDRMLLIQRQTNRARTGGVETTMRSGTLLSYRDGLVIRSENYYEVDDALEAAGLREPRA